MIGFGTDISTSYYNTNSLADSAVNSNKIDWSASIGKVWWEELGRTVLGSATDTISVNLSSNRAVLMVLFSSINSGANSLTLRFNSDNGANYACRLTSAGTESTTTNAAGILFFAGSQRCQMQAVVENISNQEKIANIIMGDRGSSGASSVPGRVLATGKWANTGSLISSVQVVNSDTGDLASGTKLIVLGHD